MGLFTNGNHRCVSCGTKTKKKKFTLADGEYICSSCNSKISSSYVLSELRTDKGYPTVDTNQMKQMQAFYEEAAKRAKQFDTSFKAENLYIDEKHGWYFILKREIYRLYTDVNEILQTPVEIFSVNDVERIEYRAYRFGYDGKNYEFYHFIHKNGLLPYTPYHIMELSMNRDPSLRLEVKFKQLFPNAEVDIPSFSMQAIIRTMYIGEKATLDQLPLRRKALNEQIDKLIAGNLPDKCKHLARQYFLLDNHLASNLDLLKDMRNFTNDVLLKENIAECISYLTRMTKLYQEIEKIVMKQNSALMSKQGVK